MSSERDGEVVQKSERRIVVRGHLSAEEMQRLTGWSGAVLHAWWRHAFTPYAQRQLFATPRGRFVSARGPGRGAFAVTILNIRRESQCGT